MPAPEVVLWSQIRGNKLGARFRRQVSIGRYIVDFYCAKKKLAIELDGDSHYTSDAQEYDKIRDEYINACGIKVIRYTNHDIMNNLKGVLTDIQRQLI